MKKFAAIFLILVIATHAHADVRLFSWQESRAEKTGERQFGFVLAPNEVMKLLEADARSDVKTTKTLSAKLPKDAWAYGLLLTGESMAYTKEKIALFEPFPCGSALEIASGSVEVDRKHGAVQVTLKVIQDGKLSDFRGNGLYRIKIEPRQPTQS